jgi:hypothetical protein
VTIQPDKDGPLAVLREQMDLERHDTACLLRLGFSDDCDCSQPARRDTLAQVEALVEAARHMVAVYPDPTSIATNRLYFALAPFMKATP